MCLILFIGLSYSAYCEEQKRQSTEDTSQTCAAIDPQSIYSKDNMQIFFNGKNAHHAGAYSTAFRLLMPLAEKGHKRAQTGVGLMYLHGDGLDKDEEKAIEWFKKASCQNHDWAHYHLGTSYYYGEGVPIDFEQSFKYFQMASLNNNASAFLSLGHLYSSGNGIKKNHSLAKENYKKALKLGEIDAAFFLGVINYGGGQLPKDSVIALMWFKIADVSGDSSASVFIENLKAELLTDDILEATEMAKKCILSGYSLCEVRQL